MYFNWERKSCKHYFDQHHTPQLTYGLQLFTSISFLSFYFVASKNLCFFLKLFFYKFTYLSYVFFFVRFHAFHHAQAFFHPISKLKRIHPPKPVHVMLYERLTHSTQLVQDYKIMQIYNNIFVRIRDNIC